MWIPALVTTLGPTALFMLQKLVYFYNEVNDLSDNLAEIVQNQEILLNQQKELNLKMEQSIFKAEEFRYISYLTFTNLFLVIGTIAVIAGGFYIYSSIGITSDVLQAVQESNKVSTENLTTVNNELIDILQTLNNLGTTNIVESNKGVIEALQKLNEVFESNLNKTSQGVLQALGKLNENNVEISQIQISHLKNIIEIIGKGFVNANTKTNVLINDKTNLDWSDFKIV